MTWDMERRLVELRFLDGVEKVEHVPYSTGDQFWVRFNRPLDLAKIHDVVKKHGYVMVKFANIPSKLPRALAEVLWDGVKFVIAKKISGWSSFTSSLGFEPDGIAKIAKDLHGPYEIFIATDEDGVQVLYEYLGLKYVPPPPPPKPVAQAKPAAPAVAKPDQPVAPRPATPVAPATAKPSPPSSAAQPKPVGQQQPAPPTAKAQQTAAATQTQPKKDPPAEPAS